MPQYTGKFAVDMSHPFFTASVTCQSFMHQSCRVAEINTDQSAPNTDKCDKLQNLPQFISKYHLVHCLSAIDDLLRWESFGAGTMGVNLFYKVGETNLPIWKENMHVSTKCEAPMAWGPGPTSHLRAPGNFGF